MEGKDLGALNAPEAAGSRTQSMIDALKSGASLSIGTEAPSVGLDSPIEESLVEAEETSSEELELNSDTETVEEEVNEDLSNSAEEDSLEADSTELGSVIVEEDIREVNVTDAKGKRKVKVDFSDKDKLTKYVQLAYGARKWQKERDDFKTQLAEKTELWNQFEEAWKGGYRSLVNQLEGSEDAFDKIIEEEIQRRQELEDMSPAERRAREVEERIRKQEFEAERLKSDYQKKLETIEAKEREAEQRELQNRFNPSFERYRFAGKLGDAVAEHRFDKALWTEVIDTLSEIPDNVEITQAMVDREFRKAAQEMKKFISVQAEKQVKKVIETKKKVAANKVQAAVKRNMVKKDSADDIRGSLKGGNFVEGLTNFFKAGGKMG